MRPFHLTQRGRVARARVSSFSAGRIGQRVAELLASESSRLLRPLLPPDTPIETRVVLEPRARAHGDGCGLSIVVQTGVLVCVCVCGRDYGFLSVTMSLAVTMADSGELFFCPWP